jgi:hypothetical protein
MASEQVIRSASASGLARTTRQALGLPSAPTVMAIVTLLPMRASRLAFG